MLFTRFRCHSADLTIRERLPEAARSHLPFAFCEFTDLWFQVSDQVLSRTCVMVRC